MRYCALVICCAALCVCSVSAAFDLASVERKIAKLPIFASDEPLYCLLVFGAEAKTRVWLVRDGRVLYVDRNANGDLTEPGERVEATPGSEESDSPVVSFRVGDIPDGPLLHKALGVSWINVKHLDGRDYDVTLRLKQKPDYRAVTMSCDVALPGYTGRGIDGRVEQSVVIGDIAGLMDFAPRVADAPILHFGGPWQIVPTGKVAVRIGRSDDFYLEIGTPGLGPGTTVSTAYENVIPAGILARVDFVLPATAGGTLTPGFDLKRRCCHVNFYGDVRLTDDVAPGEGQVTVSLPGWAGGSVAPSTHKVKLLPAIPGPQLKPISARLVDKLEHQNPDGEIGRVQFSSDGRHLVAGDYPGGLIHTWDLASRKRLATIDAGAGGRASKGYFRISPDGQHIYTATNNRGDFEKLERDGQTLHRVAYSDKLQAWNTATGELESSWQQEPPRKILFFELTPDGQHLLVTEETPGEFSGHRPRALSLLDVRSGAFRQLFDGYILAYTIDPRTQVTAAMFPRPPEMMYHDSIAFYRLPQWTELTRIPLAELQEAYVTAYVAGGTIAVGQVKTFASRENFKDYQTQVRFWEVASGKVLHTVDFEPGERFNSLVGPDDKLFVLTSLHTVTGKARMLLVDSGDWSTRELPLADRAYVRSLEFHPQEKWLAVSQLSYPRESRREPPIESLEQPWIDLYEFPSGRKLETILAPQSYQASIAFSPDGRMLASASHGAVLLWDLSTPPGELPAEPAVGHTLDLAATPLHTASGETFDAARLSGKVTLVSFWATWCAPCVAEFPELRAIYDQLHDRGFEILSVSLDDNEVDLVDFTARQQLPWTVLHETAPQATGMNHPLARRLAVDHAPRSFLLDGQGKILAIDPPIHELEKLVGEELPVKQTSQQQ